MEVGPEFDSFKAVFEIMDSLIYLANKHDITLDFNKWGINFRKRCRSDSGVFRSISNIKRNVSLVDQQSYKELLDRYLEKMKAKEFYNYSFIREPDIAMYENMVLRFENKVFEENYQVWKTMNLLECVSSSHNKSKLKI